MAENKPSGKLWMWSIIVSVSLFILFFVSFAVWTFQSDVELVYDNYYAKDVVYEQQIRRIERTDALLVKPVISYDGNTETIMIKFPAKMNHLKPVGEILIFRPADLHKDRLFSLSLDGDTLQVISLPRLDKGLWRAKLSWKSKNLEYYMEQALMIN